MNIALLLIQIFLGQLVLDNAPADGTATVSAVPEIKIGTRPDDGSSSNVTANAYPEIRNGSGQLKTPTDPLAAAGLFSRRLCMGTPLILDATIHAQIRDLCEFAATQPIDMTTLKARLDTPEGKAAQASRQMSRQTISIPFAYLATFSIETGHPCGTCRHLSMSAQREGRVVNFPALWLVAEQLRILGRPPILFRLEGRAARRSGSR